jgi:tRNA-2-methylthio-N6-dimethylallyladenosine synthase
MGLDVMQAYRDLPQLCSHLHLPVQSGSSRILRRMKRFYTRDRYLEVVDQLRSARPDMSFSTDFIIGFPGETDEDFKMTMSLLEEVRFHSSFSFKYSERPGTPALKLVKKSPVDPMVAGARLIELQKRQRAIAQEEHVLLEGGVYPVLVEGPSRHDEGVICGRTDTFKTINFPGDLSWVGQIHNVRVTKAFANSLRGEAVSTR